MAWRRAVNESGVDEDDDLLRQQCRNETARNGIFDVSMIAKSAKHSRIGEESKSEVSSRAMYLGMDHNLSSRTTHSTGDLILPCGSL